MPSAVSFDDFHNCLENLRKDRSGFSTVTTGPATTAIKHPHINLH